MTSSRRKRNCVRLPVPGTGRTREQTVRNVCSRFVEPPKIDLKEAPKVPQPQIVHEEGKGSAQMQIY